MIKRLKNSKGITLVALVVTIVVLLILTSVTISMSLLNNNNMFQKAKFATNTYKTAENNETAALNDISTVIDNSIAAPAVEVTIANSKGGNILSSTDNIGIKDDSGNIVTIPAGFKIASDSPTKQEQGIVIEDKDGNQFVWIPVASIANYVRTDYGKQDGTYSNYSEVMPTYEQTSVSTYHGYYIGRYEAGDKEYTASKTYRSSQVVTDTVTIKKGQIPYDFVTRDQALTLATGLKTAEGYQAKTKLCSSYAWDTAINFIQKTVPNYGTSSSQGNCSDTTFNYIDITGANVTKTLSSSVMIPTGRTTPLCSIYDMGGNEWEWTTESSSISNNPYVYCGGSYDNGYSNCPAGYRHSNSTNMYAYTIGFRVSLYI